MIAFEVRFMWVIRWRSLGSGLKAVLKRSVVRAAFSTLKYVVLASQMYERLEGTGRRFFSSLNHLWKSL
jgi:hypothetical protein